MSLAKLTRRDVMVGAGAAVLTAALPAHLPAKRRQLPPPSYDEALTVGVLPHHRNKNGWPFRMGLSIGGGVRSAIGATHQLSVQWLGSDHVQLRKWKFYHPDYAHRCWMPGPLQKPNFAVAELELDCVERFVDSLPSHATLHVFSLSLGQQGIAMAIGLLARQSDPETALYTMQNQFPWSYPQPKNTDRFIIEAWDRRLKLGGRLVETAERSPLISLDKHLGPHRNV